MKHTIPSQRGSYKANIYCRLPLMGFLEPEHFLSRYIGKTSSSLNHFSHHIISLPQEIQSPDAFVRSMLARGRPYKPV